jgi:hypothetical protein
MGLLSFIVRERLLMAMEGAVIYICANLSGVNKTRGDQHITGTKNQACWEYYRILTRNQASIYIKSCQVPKYLAYIRLEISNHF